MIRHDKKGRIIFHNPLPTYIMLYCIMLVNRASSVQTIYSITKFIKGMTHNVGDKWNLTF